MQGDAISKMTKTLYINALKSLLEKKPINKITIKELSEATGLSRRTFYRYFKDIYDLLEYCYQTEIKNRLADHMEFKYWEGDLLELFNYFYSNKKISSSAISFSNREYLEKFLNDILKNSIEKIIERESHYEKLSTEKKTFLIKFYALSFSSLLINWIDEGMIDNPQYLVSNTAKILEGSIERIE